MKKLLIKKNKLIFAISFFLSIILILITSWLPIKAEQINKVSSTQQQSNLYYLPELSYSYSDFEPIIDQKTMQIHYEKHHSKYVKLLNETLQKYPEINYGSLPELLKNITLIPEEARESIRNNGGGHANHSLYWNILKPTKQDVSAPSEQLTAEIERYFGSFKDFKTEFLTKGKSHFGSGWVWLVQTPDRKLQVITTINQDSPLLTGNFPILGFDLWEHAYYLNYQNQRDTYLEALWQVIDWVNVSDRFAKIVEGGSDLAF